MEATAPNSCGVPASGNTDQYAKCYGSGLDKAGAVDPLSATNCQRDCQFGTWAAWTECSTSCYGITQRERQIAQYASGPKGKPCVGQLRETVACNPGPGAGVPDECGGAWKKRDCQISIWSLVQVHSE